MNYLRLPTGSDGRGWNPTSQHTEEKSKFFIIYSGFNLSNLSKPHFCTEVLSFAFKLSSNTYTAASMGFFLVKAEHLMNLMLKRLFTMETRYQRQLHKIRKRDL